MIEVTTTDKALFSIALSSGNDPEDHSSMLLISHGVILGLLFSQTYPEYAMALLENHKQEVLDNLKSFSFSQMREIFLQIIQAYPQDYPIEIEADRVNKEQTTDG